MDKLEFFDSNCMIGRRTAPRVETNVTIEETIEELDRAGIEQALVVHSYAKEYDARTGNEKLSEVCAKYGRLYPCYVLLPHYTGEIPTGDELVSYLRDGNAVAARLYPREHNYGLGETWCGSLFSTLEEANVPVLIDLDQTNWTEIDSVLAAHPKLNLIILRVGYRIDRWVYPLFERYRGLRLETAFYQLHLGIETVTECFGPERLVFGTGLPIWDAGGAMSPILYAAISYEAKKKIASENLKEILAKFRS